MQSLASMQQRVLGRAVPRRPQVGTRIPGRQTHVRVQAHAAHPSGTHAGCCPSSVTARAQDGKLVARAASETVTVDAPQAEAVNERYVWTKQWYPIASLDEIDETRPHQVTLMGEDYVVWRDDKAQWHVFADHCPHRLAPLSEGRIEKDGSLLCAYHAWRFDGSGACTSIPQARTDAGSAEANATANPRACATAYPTKVVQGLIWVWPEAGALAELEASATPANIMTELEDEEQAKNMKLTRWRTHELPYGVDYFWENVTCPAHVVVSHHGIIGNRYTDAKPVEVDITRPLSLKGGFTGSIKNPTFNVRSLTHFYPPNLVKIEAVQPDGGKTILMLYAVPTTPGHCKHIGRQVFVKGSSGKFPPGISLFGWDLPLWFTHVLAPAFLHQDAVFLHWQERIAQLPQYKDKPAIERYYCPTPADKMVLLVRSWLEKYSPQGVPFTGEFAGVVPTAQRTRDLLFDTYNTHTKHCKVCSKAVERMKGLRVVAWVGCALAAVQVAVVLASTAAANAAALVAGGESVTAAVNTVAFALPPGPAFTWAGVGAGLAGLAVLLSKLIGLFYSMPFNHQDNN